MKKILHLNLTRKWFDLIASGEKTEEYREIKPYYDSRLGHKNFDEIHFKNGYGKDRPFMRVEYAGMEIKNILHMGLSFNKKDVAGDVYAIQLGRILEVKNYDTKTDRRIS